jgi:hypothetical protein
MEENRYKRISTSHDEYTSAMEVAGLGSVIMTVGKNGIATTFVNGAHICEIKNSEGIVVDNKLVGANYAREVLKTAES